MHTGGAGIGKQVQEIFALTHLTEHFTGNAVIEEQAGVEIVGQVHPETRIKLFNFEIVALLAELLILRFAFLALTRFHNQTVSRQLQYAQCRADNIEQALTRFIRIDGFRWRVFLNNDPVTIAIDSNVVVWQIGIINAVAFNAFLTRPLLQLLHIFTQTVCVIFRNLSRAFMAVNRQLIVFLHAIQRTVLRFKLAIGSQLQAAQQFRRGAEQRQVPAAKMLLHQTTELAVQRNQRRLALQTFTVRRVTQHCAVNRRIERIGQLQQVLLRKRKEFKDASTTGIRLRPLQHPAIVVITKKARLSRRRTRAGTVLCLGFHVLPQRSIKLVPGSKAPVFTQQARCPIAGDQRRFNQQRARTTHRVDQRRSRLPARTQHNCRRQGLF